MVRGLVKVGYVTPLLFILRFSYLDKPQKYYTLASNLTCRVCATACGGEVCYRVFFFSFFLSKTIFI